MGKSDCGISCSGVNYSSLSSQGSYTDLEQTDTDFDDW